jgi:chromosome segregation ATPase
MGSGGSFATKTVTENEQIDELTKKALALEGRVQSIPALEKGHESIRGVCSFLSKQFDELKEKLSSLEEGQKKASSDTSRQINDLRSLHASNQSQMLQHKGSDREWKELNEAKLNRTADNLSSQLSSALQGISTKSEKSDLHALKASLESVLAKVVEVSAAHSASANDNTSQARSLREKIDALTKRVEGFESKIPNLDVVQAGVESRLKEHANSVNKSSAHDRKELLGILAQLKEEILGTPASNAAVETRIMTKLEMALVDSENAVRIVKINQDRLKLIEKKIEGLLARQQDAR